MRINVYSQELTSEVNTVEKKSNCTYPSCNCSIDAIGRLECKRPPCREHDRKGAPQHG